MFKSTYSDVKKAMDHILRSVMAMADYYSPIIMHTSLLPRLYVRVTPFCFLLHRDLIILLFEK
jgi:hypothetical protein